MSIYITPSAQSIRQNPSIGLLQLDAFINESHSYTNEVASHPTEQGFSISDNIYRQPIELEIEAVISTSSVRSPIGNVPQRADNAYKKLITMRRTGSIISVLTGLTKYRNMVITNITIPRDKSNSGTLRFTISLKEIHIAKSATVTVDALADLDVFNTVSDLSEYVNVDILVADNTLVYVPPTTENGTVIGYSSQTIGLESNVPLSATDSSNIVTPSDVSPIGDAQSGSEFAGGSQTRAIEEQKLFEGAGKY